MEFIIQDLKKLERYMESCLRAGEPVHGHLMTIRICIKYIEAELAGQKNRVEKYCDHCDNPADYTDVYFAGDHSPMLTPFTLCQQCYDFMISMLGLPMFEERIVR